MATPHTTLKAGATGAEVSDWQTRLNAAGHAAPVNGVFDAATVAATKAWQAANGLVADGVVGPLSWAKMTGEEPPPQYVPAYGSKAQFGRDTLLNVWPEMLAEAAQSKHELVRQLAAMPMNLSELQITQAQAHLESNYGLAQYKNNSVDPPIFSGVINNWGAVQAGKPPCDPSQSFEASDSGEAGAYTACYRKYPTPEAGAIGMLREMTIRRPTSWALMKTGDIDAWATQMHSWTPPLTKTGGGGKVPGAVQNKDPVTGVFGYFEQVPVLGNNSRGKGIYERAYAISQALGEPLEVARGGPWVPPGPDGEPPDDGQPPTPGEVATGVGGLALLAALGGGGWYLWRSGALSRLSRQANQLIRRLRP